MILHSRHLFAAFLAVAAFTILSTQAQDAAEVKRPAITEISHLALYAHDRDKSLAFYTNFLGFAQAPYVKKNKDGTIHLIWIKINDTQTLELFEEPTNRVGDTDRLYHLGLVTDDAEGMRQYLAVKGVKVPDTTPLGSTKNKNYFIKDPDGHIIEMVQYMPDGATMKDKGHSMPDTRISIHLPHAGLTVQLGCVAEILPGHSRLQGNLARQFQRKNLKLGASTDSQRHRLHRIDARRSEARAHGHTAPLLSGGSGHRQGL